MLKIVVYSHYFAPSVGGVESSVEALARGLSRYRERDGDLEFEVAVVTNVVAGTFDDSALPFAVVRRPGWMELAGLVRGCDALHIAGPALLPLLFGRIFRKPTVVEHHGYQAICPNGALLHEPNRAVCPGHFHVGELSQCFRCQRSELSSVTGSLRKLVLTGLRNALCRGVENIAITDHVKSRHALPNSSTIYYGIDQGLPEEAPAASNSSKLCFAYVGRFVPEKGIPVLLGAAAQLQKHGHDFEVLLVGDGPERTRLEAEIARQNLEARVRITGFLRGAQLAAVLRDVHVVVMPSVWEETAGLSAIEQMMRGRLVIASAIGGLREVVGSAGMVCSPGDAGALATCMSAVLAHPERIAAVGIQARERALRTFGYERMLREHAQVYRRVASQHAALRRPGR